MARKRRAVECVSYLDEDPYEEADEKSLMIDLNAETERGTSNKGLKKDSEKCNGGLGNVREVEQQLRTQLKEERQEHRQALLDIRALIDRHIAKVKFAQLN